MMVEGREMYRIERSLMIWGEWGSSPSRADWMMPETHRTRTQLCYRKFRRERRIGWKERTRKVDEGKRRRLRDNLKHDQIGSEGELLLRVDDRADVLNIDVEELVGRDGRVENGCWS
jgi:hypothetical protein